MTYDTDKFPTFQGGNLVVPFTVWRKIQALTKAVNTEFFAYLLRDVEDYADNEDPFVVDDIFVPTQEASAAFVDMNYADFNTLNEYCVENGVFTIGNIHSHVNMGVSPSHTDLNDNIAKHLTQPGMVWHENGYIVTLIVNKQGECSARIDVLVETKGKYKWLKKPTAAFEMEVLIERPDDPEEIKLWVDDAKTKLRKKTYSGYRSPVYDSMYGAYTKREYKEQGITGLFYGVDDDTELDRHDLAMHRWVIIRELLTAGYTIALDSRPTSEYTGILVTREAGNTSDNHDVPITFTGKALKNRQKAVSRHKQSIITHLVHGDGVYVEFEGKQILRYWEDRGVTLSDTDCARLCFTYDPPYATTAMPSEKRTTLWEDHKDDYMDDIEDTITRLCGDAAHISVTNPATEDGWDDSKLQEGVNYHI